MFLSKHVMSLLCHYVNALETEFYAHQLINSEEFFLALKTSLLNIYDNSIQK